MVKFTIERHLAESFFNIMSDIFSMHSESLTVDS